MHSLICSDFSIESFRFSHGEKQTTTAKKIKRMSKDLDANNNLADTCTGFQNDWPLSNNDEKFTKSSRIIKRLLTTSLPKWITTWPNGTTF
jgi:hypothetical protein